jgi:CMP-N-acetylneuraminic acid synthetase
VEVLGIIPARGGSRGVPRKNLAMLAGRPLVAYTFDAARKSHSLTRIVLSTDDAEIAEYGRLHGIEVCMRPSELAGDDTPAVPVVQHVISHLEGNGYRSDIIVILQPTSPLRRAEHIDGAVQALISSGGDSVVTVVEVPHHFNPVSVMRIEDGRLVPFLAGHGTSVLRRQDKPRVYARNGAAVYAVRTDVIKAGSLFGSDSRPYEMSPADSVDIDRPEDLVIAEALLRAKGAA